MQTTFNDTATVSNYLGKVYAWLTGAILVTMVSAYGTTTFGARETVDLGKGVIISATPLVAWCCKYPLLMVVGYLFFGLAAIWFKRQKLYGPPLFLLFSVLTGIILGPSIMFVEVKASMGATLTSNPVRDALVMSTAVFVGLTLYALISKRDFSALGGFLFTGLVVVVIAGCLNVFYQSNVVGLALASVTILIFSGYMLYDTSRIMRGERANAVDDAFDLYLNAINFFTSFLRIFGSSND